MTLIGPSTVQATGPVDDRSFGLGLSEPIVQTSRRGEKMNRVDGLSFQSGSASGATVWVDPLQQRQTLLGIGSSFTEASAFVLAHLDGASRRAVMSNAFSASGANFAMARTPIGPCDFSVVGRSSYDDVPDDTALRYFSVDGDDDGFRSSEYPGIRDERYDLLPMIREAIDIKRGQEDQALRIVASAWTAPAWMKDIEDWYRPPDRHNGRAGTGGRLKPEYRATYAAYLVKYLEAYRQRGVDIWAITPVNEPLGNDGQWESMHFTAETQRDFLKHHLLPVLADSQHAQVKLLVYDHNRKDLPRWLDVVYGDEDCARAVYGAAVHWYDSTCKVYEDVFETVHRRNPGHAIVHTEGCIDDLGRPAPPGVADPDGFQERDWFGNDDFWWGENATDWAYSANWPGVRAEDHPKYAPVHRYARDIIVGMNHWVEGWIDWNLVLDRHGGPNHVGNYCGAPIMVDTASRQVYYTPVYQVLAQLSRSVRPGDRVVGAGIHDAAEHAGIYSMASMSAEGMLAVQVLNTSSERWPYSLQIGRQFATCAIEADTLQTIRVRLPGLQ